MAKKKEQAPPPESIEPVLQKKETPKTVLSNPRQRTIKVVDQSEKKATDSIGKAETMLYRLWQKSRDALTKKDGNGHNTDADTKVADDAPNSTKESVNAFYNEIAVDKENMPSWITRDESPDPLHDLWKNWSTGSMVYDPESFMTGNETELRPFWEQIRQTARVILLGDEARVSENAFEASTILLRTSRDYMTEWMFILPPKSGGTSISAEEIAVALDESRIKFGIDWDFAQKVINERLYFKMIPIAKGQAPVDGIDGKLTECYAREATLSLKERPDGTIDYKSSGSTRLISIGDVICRLEPPTEPINGIDVRSSKVPAKAGKPAHFPRIKNTVVSPEGDELRSTISGHIYYENDQFVVENLLVIDGNVDGTVGNLNYDGDIRIQGDICEGFTIKATKNIVVGGMIASAKVISGGNITVEKGVNGNGMGSLDAKGIICSKFLENCTATSGGDIIAESIIWSDLFCRGNIIVKAGRGVIIGGSVVALESITAQVIGNSSRRPIDITLGCPPEVLEKRDKLEAELSMLQKELAALVKDINFLCGKNDDLRRSKQYSELCLKRPLLQMKERRITSQLNDAYEIISASKRGTLRCETLFPPARIFIGAGILQVSEPHNNCLVYESGGKVIIGSK